MRRGKVSKAQDLPAVWLWTRQKADYRPALCLVVPGVCLVVPGVCLVVLAEVSEALLRTPAIREFET